MNALVSPPFSLSADGETLLGSSLSAELTQARAALDGNNPVIAPLTSRAVLRASGPDALDFLQNLLTNDVKMLASGESRLAGFCTPKGRLSALFSVLRDPWQTDDLLLVLAADLAPTLLKRLSMYVLRSKVKLTDASADFILLGLAGLAHEMPPVVTGAAALPLNRLLQPRLQFILVRADHASAGAALATQYAPVGPAAWRLIEIGAGFPVVQQATQDAFVPQMLNLELKAVGGVNFRKGCYPGQEIVARTQYLGKIKRRTYRVRFDAATAAAVGAGTSVFAPETGDQPCGTVVAVAPAPEGGYEALVCVQSGAVEAGLVHVGAVDGPLLAFLSLPYALDGPDTRAD